MHEWMTDNQQTPHLVVDAGVEGVEVPRQYVQEGKIILNISHSATGGLMLGNDRVEFNARFGGHTQHVRVPLQAVLGIYARETGQGMIFSEADWPTDTPPAPTPAPAPTEGTAASPAASKAAKRAQFKVVK
jgi:stringent starvation protein B